MRLKGFDKQEEHMIGRVYTIKRGSKVSHVTSRHATRTRCGREVEHSDPVSDVLFPGSRLCKQCNWNIRWHEKQAAKRLVAIP
jgi:hypothetical protein